jgi:hypothetical protein
LPALIGYGSPKLSAEARDQLTEWTTAAATR